MQLREIIEILQNYDEKNKNPEDIEVKINIFNSSGNNEHNIKCVINYTDENSLLISNRQLNN